MEVEVEVQSARTKQRRFVSKSILHSPVSTEALIKCLIVLHCSTAQTLIDHMKKSIKAALYSQWLVSVMCTAALCLSLQINTWPRIECDAYLDQLYLKQIACKAALNRYTIYLAATRYYILETY